jgi:hypothetical protein
MSLKMAGTQTAFLLLIGCKSEPEWVTSNLVLEVHIVSDSPKVQHLVSSQEEHDAAELRWLRGEHPPGQPEPIEEKSDARSLHHFLDQMAAEPGFSVRGNTPCRMLKISAARCSRYRRDTWTYVKVRITAGPERGREGWACSVVDVASTAPAFP